MKFPKSIKKLLTKNVYLRVFIIIAASTALTAITAFILYLNFFSSKIYPNVFVAGYDLSSLKQDEAVDLLNSNITAPTEISTNEVNFKINLSNVNLAYDIEKSVQNAYLIGRDGNILKNFIVAIKSFYQKNNLPLEYSLDSSKLEENILVLSEQISVEPTYPSVNLENNTISIDPGQAGKILDIEKLKEEVYSNISLNKNDPVNLTLTNIDPSWTEEDQANIKVRAEFLLEKEMQLASDDIDISLKGTDIIKTLDKNNSYSDIRIVEIIDDIRPQIEQEAQNPVFVFEDGIVNEFAPAKQGRKIIEEEFISEFKLALSQLEKDQNIVNFEIPLATTEPEYTSDEANRLGIKELLGKGTSKFSGSATSRIHNIGVATAKFHGLLLEPGETMSFNEILGDVSTYSGYQQAYVIRNGRTVLGDGGGVCQVSTTLFRASLEAGLPIVERQAHSYRVSYYEQDSPPGLDATVYDPAPDLKIKNDTPGHILIQAYFNPSAATLAFEIYGTDDGRVATYTTPQILSTSPPPEDLYVDDPTLPTGQIKQVDWKASGAKVHFKYTVTRNAETIFEKDFYSTYRPWQSVFLRGTGPAQI